MKEINFRSNYIIIGDLRNTEFDTLCLSRLYAQLTLFYVAYLVSPFSIGHGRGPYVEFFPIDALPFENESKT